MTSDTTQVLIVLEVAERHRGGQDVSTFLLDLSTTLKSVVDGIPVHQRRLDRLVEFFEDLSTTCLRKSSEGRAGCFTRGCF